MAIIKLSNRLQAIASFVSYGAKVADIGTDHGYIPVWLAQNNIAFQITAADIKKGPLDHAIRTAAEYGVSDKIHFRLCSGLAFTDSAANDTVIVAGMGGELIISILEAAPWTKKNTKLILQPNTKIQDLVDWLTHNGYYVQHAQLVKEAGKYYQILVVVGGESRNIPNEANRLVHDLYFKLKDPLLSEYLTYLITRYQHVERGMLASKKESDELNRTQALIKQLEYMKKETEEWQL